MPGKKKSSIVLNINTPWWYIQLPTKLTTFRKPKRVYLEDIIHKIDKQSKELNENNLEKRLGGYITIVFTHIDGKSLILDPECGLGIVTAFAFVNLIYRDQHLPPVHRFDGNSHSF